MLDVYPPHRVLLSVADQSLFFPDCPLLPVFALLEFSQPMKTAQLYQDMERFREGDLVALSGILEGLAALPAPLGELLAPYQAVIRDREEHQPLLTQLAGICRDLESASIPEAALSVAAELENIMGPLPENPSRKGKRKGSSPSSEKKGVEPDPPAEKSAATLDYSGFINDRAIMDAFLQESDEFLDGAQLSLLDLEYDPDNTEAINTVFRCFHTLKSSAAFLGIKNIETVAHHMESMLQKVREGSLGISGDLIDVLFYGIGFLRDLKEVIPTSGFSRERILSAWKGMDFSGFVRLIDRIVRQHTHLKIGEILEEMGKMDSGLVEQILKTQDRENKRFGEIAVEKKLITREDLDTAVKKQETGRGGQNFVKVSVDRLNTLVDMVGELVVNQSMFRSELHKYEGLLPERDILQLESITTTIKDIVLSMGMVPVGEIFQKLRIVIRNTSRELGRLINLEIEGEDTELDRNLVEAIYDPLVHMVRNAISHGLETPDERERNGKPPVGQLTIAARYKGNGIEIAISDDGRGIDPEAVVEKALQKGLIRPEERQSVVEDWKKTCDLLFLPGFSTRDQADAVSGRGVGLDVVTQNLSRINGRVEIQSEKGKGTIFVIKLPLTLAIIDGFVIENEGRKFILPFNLVEEILVPSEVTLSRMENGMAMLRSRDRFVPVADLKNLLGGNTDTSEYDERFVYILISYDERFYALPADRVIGKQEIVIKNLNEVLRRQKLFSSGTIFGDGTIGFILDLDEILERMDEHYR